MLFKDHSVPSVESGFKGMGTVWRPGGGIEIQERIGKVLNKGRVWEKRTDSQAEIWEVEFTALVGCKE